MTETLNSAWMDALIRHQVGLARLGPAIGSKVNALIYASEADLRARLESDLAKGLSGSRLKATLKTLEMARGDAWDKAGGLWETELKNVAINEPYFLDRTLNTLSPVELQTSLPNVKTLEGIATSTPFEGATMKQWANGLRANDYSRMVQAVQIGLTQGQTGAEIARRIFGTPSALGSDGVVQRSRNEAQAISRTAVNAITGEARRLWVDENADIIEWEVFLATLDARTTLICASNDNKKYQRGKGPRPPLHWNCRSLRMPVFNDEVLGERPARPFTEKQLLREYSQKTGIKVVGSRDDLGKGHKTAYDQFARQRKRDLTGQVPAKLSYDEWLRKQTKEFQDEVLGPKRAQMFRDGMTLDKFVAKNGDTITLQKLQKLDDKHLPTPYGPPDPKGPKAPLFDPDEIKRLREAEEKAAAERKRAEQERIERERRQALERERLARIEAERKLAEERAARLAAEKRAAELKTQLEASKKPDLEGMTRKIGVPLKFAGTVDQKHKDAVARGLNKAGFGKPGQSRIGAGVELTSIEGRGVWEESQMPRGTGGLMWNGGTPATAKMRLSTHPETLKDMLGDATERKFLIRTMQTGPGPNGAMKHQLPHNTSAIAKDALEGLEMTTVHEYGHHVHLQSPRGGAIDQIILKRWNANAVDFVSNYARKNEMEWFAESYSAYHYYPRAWMEKFAPKSLSMVEEVLKASKLELSPGRSWADIAPELKAGLNV